jgi:hypothetical protein
MTEPHDVPLEILRSYSADLQTQQSVLSGREEYNAARWSDAFVTTPSRSAYCFHDRDVEWMVTTHPKHFTRQDIVDIAKGSESDLTKHRRIFIASMAWGRGTKAAFPWFTKSRTGFRDRLASLMGDRQFDVCLQRCADDLYVHDVKSAYQRLSDAKLSGIGSAFFTKTLYFLGRSFGDDWEYPLVLDSRVAMALACLFGYRELVCLSAYQPANDAIETYPRYVQRLHDWAKSLNTEGECLERLLFDIVEKKNRNGVSALGDLQSRCRAAYA